MSLRLDSRNAVPSLHVRAKGGDFVARCPVFSLNSREVPGPLERAPRNSPFKSPLLLPGSSCLKDKRVGNPQDSHPESRFCQYSES